MQGQTEPFLTPHCYYFTLFPEILVKWVEFIAYCEGLGVCDTACTVWGGFCENLCWIIASRVTPASEVVQQCPCGIY